MKKAYVKPAMYYEHFELSHNIAACSMTGDNVGTQANLASKSACSYTLASGAAVFVDAAATCTALESQFQMYCYQTGTDGMTMFHS